MPLTIGGVIGSIPVGTTAAFGRLVSVMPNDPRMFLLGNPTGSIPKGILVFDPVIAQLDPAMNDHYFESRPATALTFGLVQFMDFEITLQPPLEGMRVLANTSDGSIGFLATGASVPAGWIELNAYVYQKNDPNGVTIFLGATGSIVASRPASETVVAAATPVANPAAGAVAAGTQVILTSATPGARIVFTLDGSNPTSASASYTVPIVVTSAVTIRAVALAEDLGPSAMLTAAYTIA